MAALVDEVLELALADHLEVDLDEGLARRSVRTEPVFVSVCGERDSFEVFVGIFSIDISVDGGTADIPLLFPCAAKKIDVLSLVVDAPGYGEVSR